MSDLPIQAATKPQSTINALRKAYDHNETSPDGALQELIDILSKPFVQSCMHCQGWGINPDNRICPSCAGKGSLLRAR